MTTPSTIWLMTLASSAARDFSAAKAEVAMRSARTRFENDPDYYLVGNGSGSTVADVEARAPYRSLSAVEEGNVYLVEDDLLSRPGPRIVDGVRLVAEKIHPDAF